MTIYSKEKIFIDIRSNAKTTTAPVMNRIITKSILFLLLGCLISACAADLPIFKIPGGPTQAINFPQAGYLPASSAGNYTILSTSVQLRILKRSESSGLFYTRWFTSQACSFVATNGVWFACATNSELQLFTFNEATSSIGTMIKYPEVYYRIQFLPDNTFVAMNTTSLVTRVNNGGTWDVVDETTVSATNVIPLGIPMHVTGPYLAYLSVNFIVLMQRNDNYTWTELERVQILNDGDLLQPIRLLWINDSIVMGYSFFAQVEGYDTMIRVYVKNENTWNVTLETSGKGFIQPSGALGINMVMVSETKVLLAAIFDNTANAPDLRGVGSVVSLERGADKQWRIAALIQQEVRDRIWGADLVKTDQEILVWNCIFSGPGTSEAMCGFTPVPFCYGDPIDVTCVNQQLTSCADLRSFVMEELYTIHNPGCGIQPVVSQASFSGQSLEISFDFSRFGVKLASCNATVTCPLMNTPSDAPQGSITEPTSVPKSVAVPVAKTGNNVSGSSRTILSVTAIITALIVTAL